MKISLPDEQAWSSSREGVSRSGELLLGEPDQLSGVLAEHVGGGNGSPG